MTSHLESQDVLQINFDFGFLLHLRKLSAR